MLIVDTREQNPLEFVPTHGVQVVRQMVEVGDYTASYGDILDTGVVERKSVADLYQSFTGDNYDNERAKIVKAKGLGLKYIIAIEASASKVREGHRYWKGGEWHEVKKDGLSMIRQLYTISRKYGVEVWFCDGRVDMAFRIMEYFLTPERIKG